MEDIIYYYITDWVNLSDKYIPGCCYKLYMNSKKPYQLSKDKGKDFWEYKCCRKRNIIITTIND